MMRVPSQVARPEGDGSSSRPYRGDAEIATYLTSQGLRDPLSCGRENLPVLLIRGFQAYFQEIHVTLGETTHTVPAKFPQSGTRSDPYLEFSPDDIDKIVRHQKNSDEPQTEVFFKNSAGMLYKVFAEDGDVAKEWKVTIEEITRQNP